MSVGNSNIQSTSCLTRVLCGLLTFIFVCPQMVHAQVLPSKIDSEPTDEQQRLPSDRRISQNLQELGRLARSGKTGSIRDALKRLRAADPSLMVPDGSKTFRPLHRDLIERIQSFPAELQAELLNEPNATSRLLHASYQDNGPVGLVIFLHRYAGSRESFKAHLMLAAIHRDRGHRQATLYWLDPVLHSSVPADLHNIAVAMRDEVNASANITPSADSNPSADSDEDLELEPVPAAEADNAASKEKTADPEDLADIETAETRRAVAAANDTTSRSKVISKVLKSGPAWQQKLYLNSVERHASQDLVRLLAADGDKQAIAWIAGEPAVDAKAVYVRSSSGLLAYDRITGKVLWTRPLDRQDSRREIPGRMPFPDGDERSDNDLERLQNSREILQLHRAAIRAYITSDETRLFVISDSGEPLAAMPEFDQPFGMLSRRTDLATHAPQELVALDKETGRRLWSVGGAPLEERFGNELSQAWFAGAPTVSGGLLFGMVEHDDAHWLVCLRSETGEVVWKLILAYPEVNILQDPVRQLSSSRPLVADGLIWASTTDGWLTAIDELTRSALWSRSMTSKKTNSPQRPVSSRHASDTTSGFNWRHLAT